MFSFKSAGTTAGNVAAGSCAEPDRPRSWRGRAKGIELSGGLGGSDVAPIHAGRHRRVSMVVQADVDERSLSDLEHFEESELDNVEESNDDLTLNMPADEHSRLTMMKAGGNRNSLPASITHSTSPPSSASTPTSGPGPSGMFKLLRKMSSVTDLLKLEVPQGNAKSKSDGRSEFARLYAETFTKISAERTYRKISAEHKHSKSEACLTTNISAERTYRKISDEHRHSKSEASLANCREISVDRCRSEISSGSKLCLRRSPSL